MDVEAQLPLWLRDVAARPDAELLACPDALLLRALLRKAARPSSASSGQSCTCHGDDTSQLQAVLAAYTAVCILEPQQRSASAHHPGDAERQLLGVLAELGQARSMHATLGAAVDEAAAAARWRARLLVAAKPAGCNSTGVREAALEYFTAEATLQRAAAGQLLSQSLGSRALSLAAGFSPAAASSLELEVMCLALLLPVWESVLQRVAGSGGSLHAQHAAYAAKDAASSDCHSQLSSFLCTVCAEHPGSILVLPPPLLAEVCRQSFRFACSYAEVLRRQRELWRASGGAGGGVDDPLSCHAEHVALHGDHISSYFTAKLAAIDLSQ
eukprot:scaffold9.g3110.t1